jgi:hypothetical protein
VLQLKHLVTPAAMGQSFHLLVASKGIAPEEVSAPTVLTFGRDKAAHWQRAIGHEPSLLRSNWFRVAGIREDGNMPKLGEVAYNPLYSHGGA